MECIVDDQDLVLEYHPGQGAWTYRIVIPHSRDIPGTWKHIKVSGTIDGYAITKRNLSPRRNLDKMLSINADIRQHTGKLPGQTLRVTLYLHPSNLLRTETELLSCLDEVGVLAQFRNLAPEKQRDLLHRILALQDKQRQEKKLLALIDSLAT